MRRRGMGAGFAAWLASGTLLAACSSSEDAEPVAGPPDPGPMDTPDAEPPLRPGDWASFGGDLGHSRARGGDQGITSGNVATLQLSWSVEAPGMSATPAIYDGVVYWADWQ